MHNFYLFIVSISVQSFIATCRLCILQRNICNIESYERLVAGVLGNMNFHVRGKKGLTWLDFHARGNYVLEAMGFSMRVEILCFRAHGVCLHMVRKYDILYR